MRSLFIAAGWHAGRRTGVDARVPLRHPARVILEELGGLHVGQCGAGIECAASDLEFRSCEVDDDVISVWSQLLRSKLVAVAEVHHRHGWLLVDETGRCFGASQINDSFYYEGGNSGEAIERLLLGRRARPMLRPDEDEVVLYGETFSRGHPSVFAYDS
ncbi:SUKH-3 domain-containing protein [Bradyrhizobium iriomotense]|uniref:SUKH-3 domain-containing protein n=1 Tax=Bradyrhizobium iriomotense TaxID=441950 RepID=UPI003D67E169